MPNSLPNSVKYNLYSACVLSILLYGSQAWFADISHLRLLENFYWKDLRRYYGRNDYSTLRTSNNTPISYELIERDLCFFISIVLGKTRIKFQDFFSFKTNSKMLRTNFHDHIVVSPMKKQLTAKLFFFKRVQIYVNDLSKTGNLNILSSPANYEFLLKAFFDTLRDSKINPDVICSWSVKCCDFCRS